MGVECAHYLVPRQRSFRPEPGPLAALFAALTLDRWMYGAGSAGQRATGREGLFRYSAKRGPNPYISIKEPLETAAIARWPAELRLVSVVGDLQASGLRYPLSNQPPFSEAYFQLEIHTSEDYVYRCSGIIDPFPEGKLVCRCGAAVEYRLPGRRGDVFSASRVRVICERCQSPFDPTRLSANTRHPKTNEPGKLRGGLTYRFAIVVDCGKAIPDDGEVHMHPDLVSLCERHTGVTFDQITDYY